MFCCDNERKQAIGVDVKVKLRWEILMSSLDNRTIIFDLCKKLLELIVNI